MKVRHPGPSRLLNSPLRRRSENRRQRTMSRAIASVVGLNRPLRFGRAGKEGALSSRRAFSTCPSSQFLISSTLGLRRKRKPAAGPVGPFSPVMEWLECSTEIEVDVPCSVAYECYSDREANPQWMQFLSYVEVLQDKPELSRWHMKHKVFDRHIELSWLARHMQPYPNRKIHWRSVEGLPNRGVVRFFPNGPSSCRVELTTSFEIPQILVPVGSALKPIIESLLLRGLERFATVARNYQGKNSEH